MSSLKPGWKMVKFGEVVKNANLVERDPETNGVERIVGLEHIDPKNLHIRRWNSVVDGTSFTRKFVPGQTLFGKRRAYQRKVAYAEFEGICSGDILTFEPKNRKVLLPELLPFICQSDAFFDHALDTSAGSLSPRTSWTALKDFEFPLPPIDEQKRIAEILWAADESAEAERLVNANLEKLLQVKINHFAHQEAERGNEHFLADCIEPNRPITYGILKPGLNFEGGIPVVKVRDYPNGVIVLDDLLHTTPEIEKEYKRSRLVPGDILISIRGTVGRVAEVPPELDGANITQDTARLSIKSDLHHRYVRTILESNYVQRQITAKITGLAVQGINIGELRKIRIPIPDLKIQEQFASECIAIRSAQACCARSIASLKTLVEGFFEASVNGEGAHV
ncbi:restriction modification system DNA specificity domain-containing protein [Isoalcanivorax pacificus W11-5]|uniref:Restriction modification system DNA specificity domain-containing protein n=1 Tax=Isoalcanivorax pacificus W11-5 TaxID=391936 RepID=A0A0B4XLH0_9GAMM|nr:restriction endonuclease subunit S [Isoalcanivorax pacificus]AJD47530.1 restriction modification system DNA specificity domain-containing protein [Isoalcanivorax pacificus W11-5]